MSKTAAVLIVILGLVAGAVVGSLNSRGGVGSLFASRNAEPAAPQSEAVGSPSGASDEAQAVKPVATVQDLPSCMRSRGVDTDAIRRQGPRAPDHQTISAMTICYLALSSGHMCDSRWRPSVIGTIETYYAQRAIAQTYVSRRASMTPDALANAPPQEREKIAEADREARSWGGPQDQEIGATLARLVKDGYLSPGDFNAREAKEEIGRIASGLSSSKKACS